MESGAHGKCSKHLSDSGMTMPSSQMLSSIHAVTSPDCITSSRPLSISPASQTIFRQSSNRVGVLSSPVRPLSAYNVFFQLERQRMIDMCSRNPNLSVTDCADHRSPFTLKDLLKFAHDRRDTILARIPKPRRKHRKTLETVDFTSLARVIANSWKNKSPDECQAFEEYVQIEKTRYQNNLAEWNRDRNDSRLKSDTFVSEKQRNSTENIIPRSTANAFAENTASTCSTVPGDCDGSPSTTDTRNIGPNCGMKRKIIGEECDTSKRLKEQLLQPQGKFFHENEGPVSVSLNKNYWNPVCAINSNGVPSSSSINYLEDPNYTSSTTSRKGYCENNISWNQPLPGHYENCNFFSDNMTQSMLGEQSLLPLDSRFMHVEEDMHITNHIRNNTFSSRNAIQSHQNRLLQLLQEKHQKLYQQYQQNKLRQQYLLNKLHQHHQQDKLHHQQNNLHHQQHQEKLHQNQQNQLKDAGDTKQGSLNIAQPEQIVSANQPSGTSEFPQHVQQEQNDQMGNPIILLLYNTNSTILENCPNAIQPLIILPNLNLRFQDQFLS